MEHLPIMSSPVTLAEKIVKALGVSGTHTPEDIAADVDAGRMKLWHRGDTMVTTQIEVFPRVKVCRIFLVAGNKDEFWALHDEEIVPWAREYGCNRMVAGGRLGSAKSAMQHGYGSPLMSVSMEI